MADRVIFVCTLVLAGVYLYATEQLPTLEIGDPLGPKAFPRLLGVGLVLAAILLLFEMVKARKAAPANRQASASEPAGRGAPAIVAGVAVWTFLYFMVFERLGYVVATTLYLVPLMMYFNKKRPLMNVLTAVLFCAGSYLLFTKVLGVNLAPGILPL
ncbi:MAG TPA: tripartite tricarboxylate transporter TctB family protein [Burkholderiales bacterium]|nr:tripartite tricarboxylate transporter TctB family protein [Burkholderiales bacterium]